MNNSEIESDLYKLTPVGTSSLQAINIIEGSFGLKSFIGTGQATITDKGWSKNSWSTQQIENEPYFNTYKLGSHPSTYVVIPTTVYGTWFFDKNNKLVNIVVIKETDGL